MKLKVCSQCKKNGKEYYLNQGNICKECVKQNARIYKAKNKDKKKIKDAEYYHQNKEKFIKCNKRFAELNPNYKKEYSEQNQDNIKRYMKVYCDKSRDDLSDYYIKRLFLKYDKNAHITNELIEIKRIQVQIKRLIKTKQNEKCS